MLFCCLEARSKPLNIAMKFFQVLLKLLAGLLALNYLYNFDLLHHIILNLDLALRKPVRRVP